MKELDLAILESLKLISQSTTDSVSYDVQHVIEKELFKKDGKLKTIINITITKNI